MEDPKLAGVLSERATGESRYMEQLPGVINEEHLADGSTVRRCFYTPHSFPATKATLLLMGNRELDPKALARLSGDRRVELVPLREVLQLTGYIRGGVTVLGAKKDYPAYVDETLELFDIVSVSAGVRGTQVLLSPADYIRAVKPVIGPIARDKT